MHATETQPQYATLMMPTNTWRIVARNMPTLSTEGFVDLHNAITDADGKHDAFLTLQYSYADAVRIREWVHTVCGKGHITLLQPITL